MESPQENLTPVAPSLKRRLPLAIISLTLVILAMASAYFFLTRSARTLPQTGVATSTVTDKTPKYPAITLNARAFTFSSGKTISLNVPENYAINIAADGFRHVRFMAWSPDHRLFVGEMTSASDDRTGRVLIFDGFDAQTGTFANKHTYLDNLRNPNSVAFYRDQQGNEWLYIALTDKLLRYPYADGDTVPHTMPEVIATFPDFGPTAAAGGWHLTRTLAFHNSTLYVSVGSGCNSCEEPDIVRGDILEMAPDGNGSRVFAGGLRNAVGIIYADNALYATANEADHLGNDRPNDLVYKIRDGANYGWPYCYEYNGAIYADPSKQWQTPYDCSNVPLAYTELQPHSAPLGLEYFDDTFADPALRNSFLVAEHGSGAPGIGTGYKVSVVREGTSTPLINGFLLNGARQARPVDILRNDERSFFLTDDFNGVIYYLRYND